MTAFSPEPERKLTKHHIAVSIKGLEDRVYGRVPESYGTWEILQHTDGKFLTKEETIQVIEESKAKGWEVISACDFVDKKGRCKGHASSD